MCNILGPKDFEGPYKPIKIEEKEGVYLKMYQKDVTKPQRKMGHLNIVDVNDTRDVNNLIKKVEETMNKIKFRKQILQ